MTYTATITSKRQFTIPVNLFKKVGLSIGDKVLVEEKNGNLQIKSALNLVKELAGSVSIPEDKKKIDLDEAILESKKKYFQSKKI